MHTQSLHCLKLLLTGVGLCLLPLFSACDVPFNKKKLELVPVSGRITLDGEPIAGAKVVFLPRQLFIGPALPHPVASAVTDEQGRYQLQTDNAAGAPSGDYLVLVSKRDSQPAPESFELPDAELSRRLDEITPAASTEPWMSEELFPPYFNSQTELRFCVPSAGTSTADFQLSIFDRPLDRDPPGP